MGNLIDPIKVTMDFYNSEIKTIRAKQYDKKSRYIEITCTNKGVPIALDGSITKCYMKMETPDDRGIYNEAKIQSDGTVLVELTETALAHPGKALLELDFVCPSEEKGNDSLLSTMNLDIIIEKSVYSNDKIIASDEFNALTDLITKEQGRSDSLSELEDSVRKAEEIRVSNETERCNSEEKRKVSEEKRETDTKAAIDKTNEIILSATGALEIVKQKAEEVETNATNAAKSESNAKVSEQAAAKSEETATEKADSALEYATKAQSYAVGGTNSREGENSDNAKYYYEQSRDISEGLKGGLQPHGTIAFSDLPSLSDIKAGWMYNVSDEFTTTDDFKEGAGNTIPSGSNIYKTSDSKWDVLAGTPVTGVKGSAEDGYRRGNVDITPANIGLGNVDNTADADKSVAHSSSSDLAKFTGYADNVCNQLTTRTYKGTARDNGFMYMQADLDNQAVIVGINGLGETGVAYAKSATSANVAHCMRTYAANGTSHGDNFKLLCRYNTNGDNRFFLQLEGGTHEVSVAHANYANSAGTATDATKMPIAGGTFTGAVGFKNSTWNPVGDDCYMGDFNAAGCVAFKSMSSQLTGIALVGAGSNMYGRLLVQNDGGDMYLATNGAFYVSTGDNSARAVIHASAFAQDSSRRVKENIIEVSDEDAIKLLDLTPVNFDYIGDNAAKNCVGLIAEDVAPLLPKCVVGDVNCEDDDENAIRAIGIDYSKFTPYLIKLVQMQQTQIEELKETVNTLSKKITN